MDTSDNLPTVASDDDVEVLACPEGLLIGGSSEAVESYLTRLRATAGRGVRVSGLDIGSAGNATGLLAGVAAILSEAGKFVQLHPDSVKAVKVGNLIPGTDGFFRMTTRTNDGAFLQQLQFRPAAIGPTQMMSLQLMAVQIALKSAIADVEDAVRRVEGKVDDLLRLAEATRAGDVLGNHVSISRAVDFYEKHGALLDADWQSVAGLGPMINVAVEQLRNYVTRLLDSFDIELPVQDRAKKLRLVIDDNRLGESLSLLVIAEESLYQWQRLRLARVEAMQPEHLQRVIDDARDLLANQLAEDGKLYRSAKQLLDDFAKPEPIEGFRFLSVRELARQRSKLSQELDQFASARQHQVDEWTAVGIPSVLDAASAVIDNAMGSASRAVGAAGHGLIRLSEYLIEKSADDAPRGSEARKDS